MCGLFKSKAEKQKERKAERDLEARMDGIELFPGNLEEYERFKGQEYEIVDVPGKRKYLLGGFRSFKHLRYTDGEKKKYRTIVKKALELGADAIIRYTIVDYAAIRYGEMGIPIRNVKEIE